ncbi:MAG: hypothetical protein J6N95_02950 [Bacilli bacterium]|nr:hypothetical protein [Bacilli bacterium]
MATVQRANKILQIPDIPDIIQKYIDKGYDVIDKTTGAIIKRAMPHDIGALQARVVELEQELEEKNAELAKLKKAKKQTGKSVQKKV